MIEMLSVITMLKMFEMSLGLINIFMEHYLSNRTSFLLALGQGIFQSRNPVNLQNLLRTFTLEWLLASIMTLTCLPGEQRSRAVMVPDDAPLERPVAPQCLVMPS